MNHPGSDERQAIAELQAAIEVVTRYRPAGAIFRLSCDRSGVLRLVLERLEGLPLSALAAERVSPGPAQHGG